MNISNCCEAPMPNSDVSDLCPQCLEHCEVITDDGFFNDIIETIEDMTTEELEAEFIKYGYRPVRK